MVIAFVIHAGMMKEDGVAVSGMGDHTETMKGVTAVVCERRRCSRQSSILKRVCVRMHDED
jgi:hypothetical protein